MKLTYVLSFPSFFSLVEQHFEERNDGKLKTFRKNTSIVSTQAVFPF